MMEMMRRFRAQLGVLLVLSCILLASAARADLIVPTGGSMSLASGALDLGCTDIVVGGTLQIDSAIVTNARNLTIQPGGTIDGGSGSITLTGNWSNSGTFVPGTSTVSFVDNAACATASTITGMTTFSNLSLVSTLGKVYAFQANANQTVLNMLTVQGTAGASIKLVSTVPGTAAFLVLAAGGTQSIQHVGATDIWATGQPLAPNEANEGGGGNARGLFGIPLVTAPAPALDVAHLLLVAIMLVAIGTILVARMQLKPKSLSGS